MGSTPRAHRFQCSTEGCVNPSRARGMCVSCYGKWRTRTKREQRYLENRRFRQRRYWTRKREWLDRLGRACGHCGSTEDLTFDHIDPLTKRANPSKVLEGWADHRVAEEMLKCQVLCRGCNTGKSNREAPRRGQYPEAA